MASVDGTAPSVEHIRVRVLPDGRMTRADTAKYLGRAEKTLAMWSLEGKGPTPHKVGGRIFYYLADCDAFIRGGVASVVCFVIGFALTVLTTLFAA